MPFSLRSARPHPSMAPSSTVGQATVVLLSQSFWARRQMVACPAVAILEPKLEKVQVGKLSKTFFPKTYLWIVGRELRIDLYMLAYCSMVSRFKWFWKIPSQNQFRC